MPWRPLPRLSPIWKQRNFRRLWIGETISIVGDGVSDFVLPILAVVTLQVTPGQLGLLRALGSAPGIVLGLLAGVWVDRVDRRRLLVVLNVGAGAVMLSIPIAEWVGSLTLAHLYALWLAFGLLGPFWWPAWNSFLPSIVRGDDLVEANSKLMFSWSSSGIVGPALGGLLVAWFTPPGAVLFDSITFFVCAAFTLGIRPGVAPEVGADEQASRMLRQIVEGLRVTFLDPMQRAITMPRLILDFVDGISAAVIAIYVIREVGLSPSLFGVALALSAIGFAVGSAIAPRIERRLGIGTMIVLGLGLVAASPYTMVIANSGLPDVVNIAFFTLPGWIGGLGGIVQFIGLSTLRQSITPQRLLGRVFASASVVGQIARVLGALTGGLIGETVGLRPAVAVAAVLYAVPFFYSLWSPLRTASRIADEAPTPSQTPEA